MQIPHVEILLTDRISLIEAIHGYESLPNYQHIQRDTDVH